MINITFPDGSVRQYESGVSAFDIAQSISPRLAADVLAATVDVVLDDEDSMSTFDECVESVKQAFDVVEM